ncbi:MAG: hypothetical protein ACI4BD_05990 [Paludibacteraceae bacterium]
MKKQFIKSVGLDSSYSHIKKKNGVVIVSYGKESVVDTESENDTSNEDVVGFYQTSYRGVPSVSTILKDITEDINSRAQHEILYGFCYEGVPVYLSVENQLNFSSAYNGALLNDTYSPITLRLSTDNYKTFDSIDELKMFVLEYTKYIQSVLQKYWEIKDAIEKEDYTI